MSDQLVKIHETFWNIRGSFRIAKVLDVGTQMSLARLSDGTYALLDSYEPDGPVLTKIMERTEGGKLVSAVINLHPFHTIHVAKVASLFPDAKLYGTTRHKRLQPELAWQEPAVENPKFRESFKDDFEFTLPQGVEFVPKDENLHFASVLAFHTSSRTLHVDDTLTFSHLPLLKGLRFHPTLAKVLLKRPDAVADFRSWSAELIKLCARTDQLCTAHLRRLPPNRQSGYRLEEEVEGALMKVMTVLERHEAEHG